MPLSFTDAEPDGLQVHIELNAILSEYGFFRDMPAEKKREFDSEFERLIKRYLPYDEAR